MSKHESKQKVEELETINTSELARTNGGIVPLLVVGGLALGALLLTPGQAR
jgi:hypothetical protein